jgi:hypothetical protein
MYEVFLTIHSLNRYLIMFLGLAAILMAYTGLVNKRPFGTGDKRLGMALLGSMHLQLLIGIILYFFLSPTVQIAFTDFSAAMKNHQLRFFAVEHWLVMLTAIIIAQIGNILAKKAGNDLKKQKLSFRYYAVSMGLIFLMVFYGMSIR